MFKRLLFVAVQTLFLLMMTSSVNASYTPVFPSCSNPQGTLKVSYNEGTHYIVGGTGVAGTDAVYYTSDITLIQCFCADNGSGIQTNWWRIDALGQSEIDQLIKLGWHYVPTGSSWGLDDSTYMAKNEAYSCKPYGPPQNPPGPKDPPVCTATRPVAPQLVSVIRKGSEAVVTWTKVDLATHYTLAYGTEIGNNPYGVPNTGNVTSYTVKALDPSKTYYFYVYAVNDCMPSEPSGSAPQGSAVLGLAATGDLRFLYSVFGSALLLTTSGIALRKRG